MNCFEHTSRSVGLDFFPAHSAIPHQNGEKQLSPRVRFLAVSWLFFAEDAAKVYVDSLRTKGLRHYIFKNLWDAHPSCCEKRDHFAVRAQNSAAFVLAAVRA